MALLRKAEIFVVSIIIVTITATEHNLKNCTEAEKIYYGTYKFGACYRHGHEVIKSCYTYQRENIDPFPFDFQESDREKYSKKGEDCSNSCDYLRFLTQVCGAHYKVCHTDQERKAILKMWIKQFIREVVKRDGLFLYNTQDIFRLELENGKCNYILQEFFNTNEINKITAAIAKLGWRNQQLLQSSDGEITTSWKFLSNVTIWPMGVIANEEGTESMPILENRKDISTFRKEKVTLPSHWEYCSWKLIETYKEFADVFNFLPDFWHCDGKCNSNKGDDQAWYKTDSSVGPLGEPPTLGRYIDLHNGENQTEVYMEDLMEDKEAENISDKGIWGCHNYYRYIQNWKEIDECERYENFVNDCLEPIDRCIGNIAIREVVLYATVQYFNPSGCWQDVSNGNYFISSFMLTMFCHLFHRVVTDVLTMYYF